jgi:hypothetical protein
MRDRRNDDHLASIPTLYDKHQDARPILRAFLSSDQLFMAPEIVEAYDQSWDGCRERHSARLTAIVVITFKQVVEVVVYRIHPTGLDRINRLLR